MSRPDPDIYPEDAADYDRWWEDTRHIRTWVNGGTVQTNDLRRQLNEALSWIFETDITPKVATDG